MQQQGDLRTACRRLGDGATPAVTTATDILCSNPVPAALQPTRQARRPVKYAYNDGDGSTHYDVEYPLQIHGFDPNFHFVGMTFNPEGFADMKDKYFLLNGRSYPDTVTAGPMQTQSPTASITSRSRCRRSSTSRRAEGRCCASPTWMYRVPDPGVARHPDEGDRLQRQAAARPGGQQPVLQHQLDHAGRRRVAGRDSGLRTRHRPATRRRARCSILYTPNLDHLSNDAENFGGLMTEVHIN